MTAAQPNPKNGFAGLAILLAVLAMAGTCIAQTPGPAKSAAPKTKSAPPPFACPDPEAQKACKSYEELVRAKDIGLRSRAGGCVCFRKDSDEFFEVSFRQPYFPKHWNAELKTMEVDPEATRVGYGSAHSYKDGVDTSGVMPSVIFSGTWHTFGESAYFNAEKINFTKIDVSDPDVGLTIDDSQFNLGWKYQNKFDKFVKYSLTIQRSTGRFTESFQEESEKVPFATNAGHCVYRGE